MTQSPFATLLSPRRKERLIIYLVIAIIYAVTTGIADRQTATEPEMAAIQTQVATAPDSHDAPQKGPKERLEFLVTKVIDGDTIQVSENGLPDGPKKTVRYIGIDTPETVKPGSLVECFGKEASSKNAELVLGKFIRLERDISDTDRYGRWLRYAYVTGTSSRASATSATSAEPESYEIFINLALVREGYASAPAYPPDTKHQDEFKAAERSARLDKVGMWGAACARM